MNKDFKLWANAIRQIIPVGGRIESIGGHVNLGPKIWDWQYDARTEELYCYHRETMDVYKPATNRCQRDATRWRRIQTDVEWA